MNDFSDREKYEQAAANVVAFVVAADGFLRDRGIDPAELYRYFGEAYASGWDEYAGDLGVIGREVALNMTSGGFEAATATENGGVTVHTRWTEQHDGSGWPTPVKPTLERAIPVLFEASMARLGVRMTASMSANGLDLQLENQGED